MTIDEQVCNALAAHLDREADDDGREVWEPAGLPKLKVGDRVVFNRGECLQDHGAVLDGDIGVVTDGSLIPWGTPPSFGHRYYVDLDIKRPLRPGTRQYGVVAAACELIPLDIAAPSQPRGDEVE